MTRRLSYEAVLLINQRITGDCVVRDSDGLDSALNRPFQSAFGDDAYPTLLEKAGALLHGLAAAHAFKDGNKRTAWTTCLAFLELNGVEIERDEDAAGPFVIALVEHQEDARTAALWLAARVL